MATLPGSLIPWVEQRFFDSEGVPLAGGLIYTYVTGTTTPQDTWAVADPLDDDNLNTNPVVLDMEGRPDSGGIFFGPFSYKVAVYNSDNVFLYDVDGVASWTAFISSLGTTLATGSSNVTSGYTVLSTDQLVTVASTGGANPCIVNLPSAADRSVTDNGNGLPLTIKNIGTVALAVTPDGTDTIETLNSAFTVPGGAVPDCPSILLVSDGVSAWWILASHLCP